jgi:hypothetical protein
MVCELIALGCLVAHGDITAHKSKKLHKQWAADKIIEELEALHPEFFPVTVRKTVLPAGVINFQLDAVVPHPLPKAEFLKLYHQCGEVLHRGSMKKILSQKQPIQIYYPDITKLAQKLVDLLIFHTVSLHGGKQMFICVLRNGLDANHRAQVAIGERKDSLPPEFLAALGGVASHLAKAE